MHIVLQMKLRTFFCIALSAILSSCYYDSEEKLYPQPSEPDTTIVGCDTLDVSYLADIAPIISEHCLKCHGPSPKPGAASFHNYNRLNIYLLVKADTFLESIQHIESNGVEPMPEGKPKLSDCNIALIRSWIREGIKDN